MWGSGGTIQCDEKQRTFWKPESLSSDSVAGPFTQQYGVTTGAMSSCLSVRAHSRACGSEPPSPMMQPRGPAPPGGRGLARGSCTEPPLGPHAPLSSFCSAFPVHESGVPHRERAPLPSPLAPIWWPGTPGVWAPGSPTPRGNFSSFPPRACFSSLENSVLLPHFAPDLGQMH